MPTDQLLHPFNGDADMDRALRDLLPPMPRSTAWEAHQRDTLLTFIETGDVSAERTTPASVDGAIITLDAPSPNDRRRRAAVVLGMAAAAVLLVAGLVTAPRWRGQEIPPATAPAPAPLPTAPAPSDELLFPDVFPMLPDDHPLADQAVASCCTWQRRSDPAAQVLVAIDDGTGLSGSVLLQVYPTVTPGMWGGLEAERITVADIAGTLYSDRGTPEIKTFVADGEPVLAVQALDPVAFIEAAGGVPVHSKIGATGNLVFDVRTLPDGYSVVAEWLAAGAVVTAGTLISEEGEGMAVFVERMHPLLTRPIAGDLEYVDVNGSTGFWRDMEFDSDLVWQVSDHTWARVPRWPGADNADMLELARSVEFVDRATWEQRYDVELGSYPTREELDMIDESGASATADELLFPDLFPILPDDHPLADQATAMYGGMTGWDNSTMTQALVAIDDGTRLSGAVQLMAFSAVTPGMWGSLDAERVTVAGVVGTLYTEGGTPEIKTFVVDGEPVVAVQALDPVAFVEAAGGVPVHAKVGAAGNLVFDVRPLPDGYRVVVEPGEWHPSGAVEAVTRVPDGDNGDGMMVLVQRSNPLLVASIVGDLERIDVNGRRGWKQDGGPGSTVIWQVSDGTWALIGGAMTVDAAVELALAVEFVDRATWEQRYDVELGTYPTREEWEMIPATTVPSLIALEEIGGLPTDVPISCGSTPPRDELVDVPAVAATPQEALAAFIETVEPGLWPDGWIHTWNGEDDDPQHRFDYRRDDGQLVTVVYVDAVDGGWAATRWLSTPC